MLTSAQGTPEKPDIRGLIRAAVTAANDLEAATWLAEEAFERVLEEGMTANDIAVELDVTYAVAAQLLSRELPLSVLIQSVEYRSASDEDVSSSRRREAFRAAQISDNADQAPS